MTLETVATLPSDPVAGSPWELLLSGDGGDVYDLQPGDDHDLIAVTPLGLFRSSDNASHWHRLDTPPLTRTLLRAGSWWLGTDLGLFRSAVLDGPWQPALPGVPVTGVCVTPDEALVFAVTGDDGLLRSEDGGASWDDANPGLPGDDIIAIHLSPAFAVDRTIFIATESALFRSRNGGLAWRQVDVDATDLECFACIGDHLLLGTGGNGLWQSRDAGRTWNHQFPGVAITGFSSTVAGDPIVLTESTRFTLDSTGAALDPEPLPPGTLCLLETGDAALAGTIARGVFRLDRDGGQWVAASLGLEAISRDRVLPVDTTHILTTSSTGGLAHSVDRGATWTELDLPSNAPLIDFDARLASGQALEIAACDGTAVHLFRGGWQRLDVDDPITVAWLHGDPAIITGSGEFIHASTRARLLPARVRAVAARLYPSSADGNLIWALLRTERAGVFVCRSADLGLRWEPIFQTDGSDAVCLSVNDDPAGSETALLAIRNRLYTPLTSPDPVWTGDDTLAIAAVAVDHAHRVWLATNQGLLLLSPDFGPAERVSGHPGPLLDVAVAPPRDILVVAYGGSIWRFPLASV